MRIIYFLFFSFFVINLQAQGLYIKTGYTYSGIHGLHKDTYAFSKNKLMGAINLGIGYNLKTKKKYLHRLEFSYQRLGGKALLLPIYHRSVPNEWGTNPGPHYWVDEGLYFDLVGGNYMFGYPISDRLHLLGGMSYQYAFVEAETFFVENFDKSLHGESKIFSRFLIDGTDIGFQQYLNNNQVYGRLGAQFKLNKYFKIEGMLMHGLLAINEIDNDFFEKKHYNYGFQFNLLIFFR